MKRIVCLLLILLLISVTALSAPSAVTKAHKATHAIAMAALNDPGSRGRCSATAIGKHALLTATHCLQPTDNISVDGVPAKIAEVIGDSLDHSILLLRGAEFTEYAQFAATFTLDQGDDIFLFGNPGMYTDMFRKGYVAGYLHVDNPLAALLGMVSPRSDVQTTLFDFNGFFGDSGAAIFNSDGRIVGVNSFISGGTVGAFSTKYMGGYELRITLRQQQYAREF